MIYSKDCKEIHLELSLWPAENLFSESLKKTRNLDGSVHEPGTPSCGNGQRIPCFLKLLIDYNMVRNIRLHTG